MLLLVANVLDEVVVEGKTVVVVGACVVVVVEVVVVVVVTVLFKAVWAEDVDVLRKILEKENEDINVRSGPAGKNNHQFL